MEHRTPLNRNTLPRHLGSVITTGPESAYRTPNSRRFGPVGTATKSVQGRTIRQASSPEAEDEENNIKELLNKTWKVLRLSPLYNFNSKKSDLSQYSRSLSAHVAAEARRGVFLDVDIPGDCTVGLISGLDVSQDDHKAVLIEVKGKSRKGENTVVFQAILFSTDLEFNPISSSLRKDFTYFSAALVRGSEVLSQTVQNWLEVQFDCVVVPMNFTSHELGFMAAMFSGFDEHHKPLELVYSVPTECEGLSNITYSTKADDCRQLWDRIRMNDEDGFTVEEADQFMVALEEHFYEIFNIYLSAMSLSTIGTSVSFVSRDGKIKLYTRSTENALRVLQHLTDLAVDRLK